MDRASPEPFGDYVRRTRRSKNLSCADVSRRSARFGKRIAGGYVNRIENDPHLKPSVDRLVALARGLDVSVEDVLARAIGSVPLSERTDDELRLLAKFRELPPQRRKALLTIIDALYSQELNSIFLRAVTEQENR